MSNLTPSVIADLGRYLDHHTDCSEAVARELVRAASSSLPVDLPPAVDFAGEVLRGQLAVLLNAGGRVASASASAPVASTPASITTTPEPAPKLSVETRRTVFRAAAGPRLEAFAEALAATEASDEQAMKSIEVARANLPPDVVKAEPPAIPSVEQRAAGLPEFGASAPTMTRAQAAAEGWKAAFEKAERMPG